MWLPTALWVLRAGKSRAAKTYRASRLNVRLMITQRPSLLAKIHWSPPGA